MKLFGTDGIRGVVGEMLNETLAFDLGRAYGIALGDTKHKRILLGRDTRMSGKMLLDAVTKGLNSAGFDVLSVGVLPTPAHTYLSKVLDVDGGIMITASHNPAEHNGIKFCDADGNKLSQTMQQKIEDIVFDIDAYEVYGEGEFVEDLSLANKWIDYIFECLDNVNLSGVKVALDTANGAGFALIPEAFGRAGATVFAFNTESDGKNINNNCGSTHIEPFIEQCKKCGADIGFSFDGDADRIMAVDESGNVIDGTDMMYIFGVYYKKLGKLINNTVVSTIVTNSGLKNSLAKLGIDYCATQVGGQYVQREMMQNGYTVGGEENGHMLLGDIGEGSDGMCIGLYLLKIMKEEGVSLHQLIEGLERAKIAKADMQVTAVQKQAVADGVLDDLIDELNAIISESGRIVVRTSGTESVVRILVEGENQEILDSIRDVLKYRVLAIK